MMMLRCDALAKTRGMAKLKFRPTRSGGFSGSKAYIGYVEVLKKRRNAVGRTFCDAIKMWLTSYKSGVVRISHLSFEKGGGSLNYWLVESKVKSFSLRFASTRALISATNSEILLS